MNRNELRLIRTVEHANGAIATSAHHIMTDSPEGQAKAYREIAARTIVAIDGTKIVTLADWPL